MVIAIPLLLKHLEFIVEQHAQYSSGSADRPEGLGEILYTDWTREEISNIVSKGIEHLTQVSTNAHIPQSLLISN